MNINCILNHSPIEQLSSFLYFSITYAKVNILNGDSFEAFVLISRWKDNSISIAAISVFFNTFKTLVRTCQSANL